MDAINTLPAWAQIVIYIVTVLLAGGGISQLISFFRVKFQNKKDDADAELTLGQGWKDLLVEIRTELKTTKGELEVVKSEQARQGEVIVTQEKKMIRLGQRVIYLMQGIEILINQITDNGDDPCWRPDEWELDE